ncbi:uncharacterized protein BJ171DRAFT_475812 [Polychytrium aggregatum]|uniref:uncharacterized protein n=1 Tax=Polychytrium aggregatum TaxID=110093 RepID=UPI0022FE9DA6|nr:uncharacterized protein BJ171DRAFT_475812 [Polychytrium aggregatum]KAI9203456.1 hypothetical protein BJ171DRAFT_475812 [Polychytrium aggregatum]
MENPTPLRRNSVVTQGSAAMAIKQRRLNGSLESDASMALALSIDGSARGSPAPASLSSTVRRSPSAGSAVPMKHDTAGSSPRSSSESPKTLEEYRAQIQRETKNTSSFVSVGHLLYNLYYRDKRMKNQREFLEWTRNSLGFSKSTTYEYIISYRVYSDIDAKLPPTHRPPMYQSHCQLLSKVPSDKVVDVWLDVCRKAPKNNVTTAFLEKYLDDHNLRPKASKSRPSKHTKPSLSPDSPTPEPSHDEFDDDYDDESDGSGPVLRHHAARKNSTASSRSRRTAERTQSFSTFSRTAPSASAVNAASPFKLAQTASATGTQLYPSPPHDAKLNTNPDLMPLPPPHQIGTVDIATPNSANKVTLQNGSVYTQSIFSSGLDRMAQPGLSEYDKVGLERTHAPKNENGLPVEDCTCVCSHETGVSETTFEMDPLYRVSHRVVVDDSGSGGFSLVIHSHSDIIASTVNPWEGRMYGNFTSLRSRTSRSYYPSCIKPSPDLVEAYCQPAVPESSELKIEDILTHLFTRWSRREYIEGVFIVRAEIGAAWFTPILLHPHCFIKVPNPTLAEYARAAQHGHQLRHSGSCQTAAAGQELGKRKRTHTDATEDGLYGESIDDEICDQCHKVAYRPHETLVAFYLGQNVSRFCRVFGEIGFIPGYNTWSNPVANKIDTDFGIPPSMLSTSLGLDSTVLASSNDLGYRANSALGASLNGHPGAGMSMYQLAQTPTQLIRTQVNGQTSQPTMMFTGHPTIHTQMPATMRAIGGNGLVSEPETMLLMGHNAALVADCHSYPFDASAGPKMYQGNDEALGNLIRQAPLTAPSTPAQVGRVSNGGGLKGPVGSMTPMQSLQSMQSIQSIQSMQPIGFVDAGAPPMGLVRDRDDAAINNQFQKMAMEKSEN